MMMLMVSCVRPIYYLSNNINSSVCFENDYIKYLPCDVPYAFVCLSSCLVVVLTRLLDANYELSLPVFICHLFQLRLNSQYFKAIIYRRLLGKEKTSMLACMHRKFIEKLPNNIIKKLSKIL